MIRQSKATKRNFLTGEAIEIIKEKPLKAVRGVHTIELFDALTGKLVEQVESENFISKVMEELQRQAALFAFLTDSISSSSSGLYIQYNGPLYDLSRYDIIFNNPEMIWFTSGNFPMNWIVLTDYDGPENPENEVIMRGRVVGYAYRYSVYSGSDTKRGTINLAESFIESQHIRLVFDWPTHAANGTFNSVYWNSNNRANYSNGIVETKFLQLDAPQGYIFTNAKPRVKNGKIYFLGRNQQDNKAAILEYDFNVQTRTIGNGRVYALLNSILGFDIFDIAPNGDIYITYGNTLYCFDQNGSPKTIPGTSQTSRKYTNFLFGLFAIAGQDVYIESRTSSSDDLQINRYSINNLVNPLDVIVIPRSTVNFYNQSCNGMLFLPDLNIVTVSVGGTTYFLDRGTLDFSKETPVETYMNSNSAVAYDTTRRQFIEVRHSGVPGDNTKRDVNLHVIGFIGARNLLPSPVTKTSTNTMKLTYDLYIDF